MYVPNHPGFLVRSLRKPLSTQDAAESCLVLMLSCFEKLFLLDDLFSPDRAVLRKVGIHVWIDSFQSFDQGAGY